MAGRDGKFEGDARMRRVFLVTAPLTLAACAQEFAFNEAEVGEESSITDTAMLTANGSVTPMLAEVCGPIGF